MPMAQFRNLGSGFDPAVVAGIDAKLHHVEANQGVRILLAIESGSGGWGFPSPDSDYDCRFIHVHPQSDYLSFYPPRDVIEYPPDAIYDVNGWDIVKTLKLLLKGQYRGAAVADVALCLSRGCRVRAGPGTLAEAGNTAAI